MRIFLDSGARIAWGVGQTIDLQDYIRYCLDNARCIDQLVNLDVSFGRENTSRHDIEGAAQQSYMNQQKMKDAGLRPIPVFNQGERFHWLEQMLRDGELYIGLRASSSPAFAARWLDSVFNVLTDMRGVPFVKTHGFGLTASVRLIRSFPWYSFDVTTWDFSKYVAVQRELKDIVHKRSGALFGPDHFYVAKHLRPLDPWRATVYFATHVSHRELIEWLASNDADNHMVSYWTLKDLPTALEKLVTGELK